MSHQPEFHMDIPPYVCSNVSTNNTNTPSNLQENLNINNVHPIPMYPLTSTPRYDVQPPILDLSAPPPCENCNLVFAKLPTYEEVQIEKLLGGEKMSPRFPERIIKPPTIGANLQETPAQTLTVLTTVTAPNPCENDTNLLGTDYMYLTAFMMTLIFDWVGFLLAMCLGQTVAVRYGAFTGFGLALAKWTIIVNINNELAGTKNRTITWMCWLLWSLGLVVSIRFLIQYKKIKRYWRLFSELDRERLLYSH
ncbi:NEDD4 family-interacting protein 2-like [Adelges cooleyi]|uniref:NEDD4 family-interacting protein 2-like n=1 Tax=Adelges cooleyi TaxID=133065 RepID=UPI00217F2C47|nr:NEDD4 family-interacting protein 2-like [Adelges cooleyi]